MFLDLPRGSCCACAGGTLTAAGLTLAAWLALSATKRQDDVLIIPDVDDDWSAEGRQYGYQFIVHVEALDGAWTRLVLLLV